MPKTKGQRRAENRRAARKKINRATDPGVQVKIGYGGDIAVSHSSRHAPDFRYVVDGHEFENEDSNLAGDGEHAPFYVFDIEAQDYLPGTHATRAAAQIEADRANRHGA